MNLTLIDQLTLLALDDHKGDFIPDSTTFSYALAGALILELILEEKILVSDDYVKVIDKNPTGDLILDEYIKEISESSKQRKIKSWIDKFGQKSKKIKEATLKKLMDDGILVKKEEKLLWLFNIDKYPTNNPKPENQLRARLHNIVVNRHKPDLKEVMILNLVESCQLEVEVFGKENAKVFRKEIKKIKNDSEVTGVVNKSIKDICEAITAMLVIMIATAVTTNVSTGG
jgi:Golgi phosphoprotein 3